MDNDKNQQIAEQVERWDVYARITPTVFLLAAILLIVFGIIDFETAFYVGILGFAVTAVIWWWWAIFTIKYLREKIVLHKKPRPKQQLKQRKLKH